MLLDREDKNNIFMFVIINERQLNTSSLPASVRPGEQVSEISARQKHKYFVSKLQDNGSRQ